MADIELVIKIPEMAYQYFRQGMRFADDIEMAIIAIKNGTPIPKKQVDMDALIKHIEGLPKLPNGHSKEYDEAAIIGIINTFAESEVNDANSNQY